MILKEITIREAENILLDDSIWPRISEDGQTKKTFFLKHRPGDIWLGVFVKKTLIGCFFLHPENSTTVCIHIQIIEKYRKDHAFEAGKLAIDWFIESNFMKLICQIPVIFQDVYNFTKKFGFLDEGINRASYRKHGRLHNQLRLGMTKEEAKKTFKKRKK